MFAISNAFLFQAEIVQKDRWVGNPLEIALIDFPPRVSLNDESLKLELALHSWNQTYAAGYARQSDAFEAVTSKIPGIEHRKNPNIIIAPRTANGITELHVMLASLLPDEVLRDAGVERLRANMALALVGRHQMQ